MAFAVRSGALLVFVNSSSCFFVSFCALADFKASSSRRMSTGGPDISSSAFFPSARQKIDIVQYTSLMQKATEERAATMLYGVDDTQRVYGDDGLLFDSA